MLDLIACADKVLEFIASLQVASRRRMTEYEETAFLRAWLLAAAARDGLGSAT
jgi:hypothetical protein